MLTMDVTNRELPQFARIHDCRGIVLLDVFPFPPKTFTSLLFLECQVGIWKGL